MAAGGGLAVALLCQLAHTVRSDIIMVGIGETAGTPGQRQSSCLCLLFSPNQYMGVLETIDNIGNILH